MVLISFRFHDSCIVVSIKVFGVFLGHYIKLFDCRNSSQGMNFGNLYDQRKDFVGKYPVFSLHIYAMLGIIHRTRRLEQQR